MFKAWDREREYLKSHPASSNTNLKILYAEDDIEDALIISESLANKLLNETGDGLKNYHEAVMKMRSMTIDEINSNPCER